MKKHRHKKIAIPFFFFVLLIANIEQCNAAGVSTATTTTTTSSSSTKEGNYRDGNKYIKYTYQGSVSTNKSFNINVYSLNGESLIPNDIIIDPNKYKFKSGTWAGINVTERQESYWKLVITSFKFEEVVKNYECEYTRNVPKTCSVCRTSEGSNCVAVGSNYCPYSCTVTDGSLCGTKTETKKEPLSNIEFYETAKCPAKSGWKVGAPKEVSRGTREYSNEVVKETIIEQVRSSLISAAKGSISGGSNAQVKYITNNEYPKEVKNFNYETLTGTSKGGIKSGSTDGKTYGSFYIDYEFLQEKVCIDVKTSHVYYGRNCNENEIKVNNAVTYDKYLGKNVTYWHYFIPLNTKSNSEFPLQVIKNENSKFKKDECLSIMEKRSDYQDYIIPIGNYGLFIGDYKKYSNKNKSEDYNKLDKSDGCAISLKVKLPISQGFYHEDNDYKFKGFNFYYKPIDINNPFSNGVDQSSIWYEWSQSNNKTPDLTKSYSNKTYEANYINVNEVRNYTKNNPYTSWANMLKNGVSQFIDKENIVTRFVDKNSFYKLGCGPSNSDWSECKQ